MKFKEGLEIELKEIYTTDLKKEGSSSVPASHEMIRQMIKETDGDSYEEARSLIQNLTFDYAELLMEKLEIDFKESQKKTLGIIGEDSLYTNLGLLISDQCLHSIKIAVFQGVEKTLFKDRKEFSGSILKQVSDAFEYIDLLNRNSATFEGLIRVDKRDYPVEAIREALLNTIVHREYSFSSSTIINIYCDRIEFISLGGLVSGLSLDAIMLGVSQSRNEKIANLFYRIHYIEAYGTGIRKIITSYENENVKPTINSVEGAFQVILPNLNVENIKNEEIILQKSVDELRIKSLKNQESSVLKLINKKGTITRKEIENTLNIRQTRAGQILKELINKKIIFTIGKGKNTKYFK